jgi:hypothetical protein
MTDTWRPGVLGTTGSFGAIQVTTGASGSTPTKILDTDRNLSNLASVSASGDIQGNAGEFESAQVKDLTSGRVVLAGTNGELQDNGNLTFDGSTLAVTGDATVSGDATVTGDISAASGSFSGDMTITGDLTVNGTTTTVNSTAVSLGDRIIELNSAQAAGDSGLKVFDADSPETTGSLLYDSTDHRWKGGEEGSESILVDRGSNESITGTKTFTALTASSADINGGTVDGADVTVGSGKTLDVSAGTLTLADDQISGDKVEGGTIASITISQLGGAMDANSQAMTNVNIDSGNIDGATIATSDITVGASKTLDVSAGTLTLADDQISGDKVEGGTIAATTITTLTSTTINASTVSASSYMSASSFEVDGQASISYDSSALDFSNGDAGAALSANHFSASVELQGASLAVSGASDLGAVTMAGALDANSTADFQGAVNMQAGLTVAGALDANSTADFQGAVNLQAGLTVAGAIDANSTADFQGAVNLQAGLTVAGAADFNGGVAANTMAVEDLTSGRIVIAGTGGELEDNASFLYNGTDMSLNGGTIQMSSSAQYTADGGDKYVSVAKVYAEGKGAYLSGVAYNQTQERFAFRGDDDSFQSIQADSYYAGADYQFAGGNTTFSDGNLNFGSGTGTISGDDLTVGASEGNFLKIQMGHKPAEGGDPAASGSVRFVDIEANEYMRVDEEQISGSVAAKFASLNLASGGTTISAILDEDGLSSDSATALATQQSIKAYVDAQLGSQDVDFAGDSGTGAVDLDTQSLLIEGTSNEIETSASGQTLTIGLPDDVTIGQDLTVTRNLAVNGNVDLGSDTSDTISALGLFDSHLLPDGATRDIGSNDNRWGDVYAAIST